MCAENFCMVRQLRKFVEGSCHHGGRTFEQTTAAAGKQGIATEKPVTTVIGNVAQRMAGRVDDGKLQAEFRNRDGIPA